MVQIIPGGTDLNLGLIHDFISHMVQIIRLTPNIHICDSLCFISHMVQIIREENALAAEETYKLYIPHGSDNTLCS